MEEGPDSARKAQIPHACRAGEASLGRVQVVHDDDDVGSGGASFDIEMSP
jgi:hypothetical protein